MLAEYSPGQPSLTRCYVSGKMPVLAGHRSDEEIILEMQRRYGFNGETV